MIRSGRPDREGGTGGHFLNQKHTMKHLKQEHFLPKLSDRDSYEAWGEKGKPAIHERAKRKVKRILADINPSHLIRILRKIFWRSSKR